MNEYKKFLKKRLKKTNKKLILILIIMFLISFGLLLADELKSNDDSIIVDDYNNDILEKDNDSDDLEKDDNIDSLSMIMVGDNLIHDVIYKEAYNNETYDFKPMYEFIKPIVSQYDIAYYNQETILGGSGIGVSGYPAFNSPYEVGDAMIDSGFNLVSLATNHTLDRGESAILNSRKYWDSKDNVLAVGSYDSMDARNKIEVREVNGISYTMLNYTYGTNGISVPSGKEYLVNIWPMAGNNPDGDANYQNYKEQVKKDIERVRDSVDVLMVAMHWGVEYQYDANSYQEDCAKFLASLGVDIIIGTHAHVIQPITWIDDTLVIYSLGNFFSGHGVVNIGNRIGLMTSLNIVKDNDTGSISINDVCSELLYTYYTSDYKDFKIVPFSMINDSYLSNYEEIYNKYKNIVTKLDSNMCVVPLA